MKSVEDGPAAQRTAVVGRECGADARPAVDVVTLTREFHWVEGSLVADRAVLVVHCGQDVRGDWAECSVEHFVDGWRRWHVESLSAGVNVDLSRQRKVLLVRIVHYLFYDITWRTTMSRCHPRQGLRLSGTVVQCG